MWQSALVRWTSSRRRLAEKPIPRSAGRLWSRLPTPKSRVSLMVVSVRRARPSLWFLLDLGVLVVDVKRRGDPNGYDPGAKAPGCATGHAPRKDQGDLIGATEVQVVTDHLLEEHPSGEWAVEHLGEGELGLEDRDVVAVAGPAVLPGEGVGQAGEPLASKRVDLVGPESVTDLLEALLVLTGWCSALPREQPPRRFRTTSRPRVL